MTNRPTPFDLVSRTAQPRLVRKPEALRMSRDLEAEALQRPPAGAGVCLQDARFLTTATRRRYAALGAAGTVTRVLGEGVQSWLEPGVRGVDLEEQDPLRFQWVVVLTRPVVACFVAVDQRTAGPDDARLFEGAVTRDEDVVREVSAQLGVPFG